MKLDRRSWLKASLATTLVAMAGCRRGARDRPLTVVGWGGSSQEADRKAYYAPFTRVTGIPLQEDSWHGGLGVIRIHTRNVTEVGTAESSWAMSTPSIRRRAVVRSGLPFRIPGKPC